MDGECKERGTGSTASRIVAARDAVSELRDAARLGRIVGFRERDPLVAAIHRALDDSDKAAWTIDNIYTVARREYRRAEDGKPLRPEMWAHVLRLCEQVGAQSRTVGVLRTDDAVDPVNRGSDQ